jgi:hypothetical protein
MMKILDRIEVAACVGSISKDGDLLGNIYIDMQCDHAAVLKIMDGVTYHNILRR